jgi:hypothetical protein
MKPVEQATQGLRVDLRYPNGHTEQMTVDADSVLVGSGGHCEIRLPPEHAAVEHVVISLVNGGVYAQARSLDPHPTINGSGFVRTPVLPDSILGVGAVQLRVVPVTLSETAVVVRKKAQRMSPLTYILVAIGLPFSAYAILGATPGEGPQRAPGSPPALWGEPSRSCPQSTREAALATALEKMTLANGKRERRPFSVEDGVAAVPLFETAAACFTIAGQGAAAAEAARSAADLRNKVNDDYRVHQVRLEHALTVHDWSSAQKEVKVLHAFIQGKQAAASGSEGTPYVIWLSNVERQLAMKLASKDKSS